MYRRTTQKILKVQRKSSNQLKIIQKMRLINQRKMATQLNLLRRVTNWQENQQLTNKQGKTLQQLERWKSRNLKNQFQQIKAKNQLMKAINQKKKQNKRIIKNNQKKKKNSLILNLPVAIMKKQKIMSLKKAQKKLMKVILLNHK